MRSATLAQCAMAREWAELGFTSTGFTSKSADPHGQDYAFGLRTLLQSLLPSTSGTGTATETKYRAHEQGGTSDSCVDEEEQLTLFTECRLFR